MHSAASIWFYQRPPVTSLAGSSSNSTKIFLLPAFTDLTDLINWRLSRVFSILFTCVCAMLVCLLRSLLQTPAPDLRQLILAT